MTHSSIRPAVAEDLETLLELIPQLADFPLPASRNPVDLWKGDAELLRKHCAGNSPETVLLVSADDTGILGFALTSLRKELLSGLPSAHLEALVVSVAARGKGTGRALLQATEQVSREAGALSLTLNAFSSNTLARGLYESAGFDGELIRYTKPLSEQPADTKTD